MMKSCLVCDCAYVQAAGLKHIGFGPIKRENQDEFFIQVGQVGGQTGGNLFCVFDGHGTYGRDASRYSRQELPTLLDLEMSKYFKVGGAVRLVGRAG
jgi:serine/threonine protein phosphatase PrpC